MPNTMMAPTKTTHPDDYFPDEKYPDEVVLNINEKGEIIIGKYAVSQEVRMLFMARYKKHDCRRLAFLKEYTETGSLFARKMVSVAGIVAKGREFPDLKHPDRDCRRAIQIGWDEKTGPYNYELEVIRRPVPQLSAPKIEKDNTSRRHGKQLTTSGHHGSHGKYEKAKHRGYGKYK